MILPNKRTDYLKAIQEGFDYYGLNGFYEMHKDVIENPDNPWGYVLEPLNDLTYEEFETLCKEFLNSNQK